MRTIITTLALSLVTMNAYAADNAPAALPAKLAKAPKKAPDVEHISVGCPEPFQVSSADGGKSWIYVCASTKAEITILKATPDAHMRGSVKGDKAGAWRR